MMKKRLLSLVLAVLTALSLVSAAGAADIAPMVSDNLNSQNGTYGDTVKSYLVENDYGGLTRVEYRAAYSDWTDQWEVVQHEACVVVEEYSPSFTLLERQEIPMELPIWGGFFSGEMYNFFIFGQNNTAEDNNAEVIRVVKYSKDWERLGSDAIFGANTIRPFSAGSLRCAEYGGMLYVHTCHEMFKYIDGINHQANLTFSIREEDMKLTDCAYKISNDNHGYISHSFDQYILVDGQERIVTVDHGDAYPRTIELMVYDTPAGGDQFTGNVTSATIQKIPGSIGDNSTATSMGGLAETENGYVVAYNYETSYTGSSYPEYNKRSVYLAYVTKQGLQVTSKALSDAGALPPVVAPTGTDGGYVLWNTFEKDAYGYDSMGSTLYYARYSDGGTVGTVQTAKARLSDCQPILYNGKLTWYACGSSDTAPTFYQLDDSGVTAVKARAVFKDVPTSSEHFAAVDWALANGITTGATATTFDPAGDVTRGQLVTFLWRAMGEPKPTATANPFTDVSSKGFYYQAMLWAVENGIVEGITKTTFAPQSPCTRGQVMTVLWRTMGEPAPTGSNPYTDIQEGQYCYKAALWAAENGIDTVTGDQFAPKQKCARADVVEFLYRTLAD